MAFKGVKFPLMDEEPQMSAMPEAPEETPAQESMEHDLLEQSQVLYREGESCGDCAYFQGEGNDCSKVQGPINAAGWCLIYKGGAGAAAPMEASDAPMDL